MPVTIIAECGVNHDGSLDKALKLCDAAKFAGADIVKFQTYIPEKCIRPGKDYAMLESLALSFPDILKIARYCELIGIEFCSTPDDLDSLKFLVEECGVKRIKIGSGSLFYEPLVHAAFDTGLPILLSTGMATIDQVAGAVGFEFNRFKLGNEGEEGDRIFNLEEWNDLTIMHCVSLYPCPARLANLRRMEALKLMDGNELHDECMESVDYEIGYSDHTLGCTAPCTAVALGATVIEKHFTLDRQDAGPDHHMSLNQEQFAHMVGKIRLTETMIGGSLDDFYEVEEEISQEEAAMIPRIRKDADGFQLGL